MDILHLLGCRGGVSPAPTWPDTPNHFWWHPHGLQMRQPSVRGCFECTSLSADMVWPPPAHSVLVAISPPVRSFQVRCSAPFGVQFHTIVSRCPRYVYATLHWCQHVCLPSPPPAPQCSPSCSSGSAVWPNGMTVPTHRGACHPRPCAMPRTPQPPQKCPRTDAYLPTPMDVSQRTDFSVASPRTVLLHSAQVDAILPIINLQYMSDPDFDSGEEAEDLCNSNTASTISWAASSDSFSTDVSASRFP